MFLELKDSDTKILPNRENISNSYDPMKINSSGGYGVTPYRDNYHFQRFH